MSVNESDESAPDRGPSVELPSAAELEQLEQLEAVQSEPDTFNPLLSIAWSLGLGSLGAAIWALITVVSDYQLGIIAIVLGILAGVGAARGGRTPQSQIVGAVSAAICYFVAQILTVVALLSKEGQEISIFDPGVMEVMLIEILKGTFSSISVLFLALAVYEGYRRPRPQ
ncbi:MAG TPA: hypothetical protein ENJ18_08080 [Nannocystis exedens]|nr:hypothetical protein [Nannocystis exedens]